MSVAQQDVVHDVLFAEDDDELTRTVGDRLAAALRSGHVGIVIATPEHRQLFLDRVGAAGLDAAALQADGSLLMMDASASLDVLRPGGSFDPQAFDQLVGALVRERSADRPVFAFGEMVALLFDAGRPQEALELEAAWDELLQGTSAELLCAYPGALLDNPGHAPHVGSVCAMHSSVVAGARFDRSWTFSDHATAAASARRLVANALRARAVAEDAFYDTVGVVSELMALAVIHRDASVELELVIDDDHVTVRVGDASTASPVRLPSRGPAPRGLRLVEEIAESWGIDPSEDGKVVWARIAR